MSANIITNVAPDKSSGLYLLLQNSCAEKQGYERGLLPFDMRFDIAGIDDIPLLDHVVGMDEVLASDVFSFVRAFCAGRTSFDEYAAADECRIEYYAGDTCYLSVSKHMVYNRFPGMLSVNMFVDVLYFHADVYEFR